MGTYVNPGNHAFAEIADEDYIDMTGMIDLINRSIGKKNKLTCVSRPRRFGKSWAAKMLMAYYDCTCDSHSLFDHREIASSDTYSAWLNQLNVIYLDISGFTSTAQREGIALREIPGMIVKAIRRELLFLFSDLPVDASLEEMMIQCAQKQNGHRFIFIIDEWDAVIREAKKDTEAQERYLSLLRSWFKNDNFTPQVVAAAYMTGILPIKKDGTQTAISDFQEFSMLHPGEFARYAGFSEADVRQLCEKNSMDFEDVRTWYDGYELCGETAVYNPYSVMHAMNEHTCRSFWGKTSASEALTYYIRLDFDGLQETIASLIAGTDVIVNTDGFQNDFETFGSRDDVLTLLIHLGYLTWHSETMTAHIPNEEVRGQFTNFLTKDDPGEHWIRLIQRSTMLLNDTIAGNGDAVAAAMTEIREEQYAPQFYNNEQALRAIIKYAYLAANGKYMRIDEMPSGKGIADVVFIPLPTSREPAMVVELKWNKSAGGAIAQIRKKKYTAALSPFAGNLLLVGINYDSRTGKHTCKIEKSTISSGD